MAELGNMHSGGEDIANVSDYSAPGRPLDYVCSLCIAIACLALIIGNIILVVNRKYRPIRTRSVGLTVLSSTGGLIWVGSTIVVNKHFDRPRHSFWAKCTLWTFWLQACFGFALWLNCLIMRLLTLYLIFVRRRKHYKYPFITLFILLSPVIIFCICASAEHGSRFDKSYGDCKIHKHIWSYGLLVLLLVYFMIFIGFAFSLRNVMAQFNEFRLIRNGGIMSLFLFLLSLVTIQTQRYMTIVGRAFLSLSVTVAVSYYFWARNGEVVYNVIFHRKAYERKFHEELNRLPSEHERASFPDSFLVMETELKSTREEINRYQSNIKLLEEELSALEKRYDQSHQHSSL